ncbi:MAG: lycopene cyclase [Saprospiraceae bacterium]|nr:lycopene cyclase [Saprospiraceae bacterium]
MIKENFEYIILGSGAAGLNLAMFMAADPYFNDKKILLLDREAKIQNDRTWCFWEKGQGMWDKILLANWDRLEFISDNFDKTIPLEGYRYKMLKGLDFYSYCLGVLETKNNFSIRYDEVTQINEQPDYVEITGKHQTYHTNHVFSSVLDYKPDDTGIPTLSQHFGGWFIKTQKPVFKDAAPQFMNFKIPQNGKTCFMYVLPYKEDEALFEYTFFSKEVLTKETYDDFLKQYLAQLQLENYVVIEKEYGEIPMTSYPFWKKNTKRKTYIGSAGGYTKPSTGYTFYFCQKYSADLVNMIKANEDLSHFSVYNRHYWYDNILLGVLEKNNHLGKTIFTNMFAKNRILSILRFLNNESSLWEDIRIIAKTKYPFTFFASLLRTLKFKI